MQEKRSILKNDSILKISIVFLWISFSACNENNASKNTTKTKNTNIKNQELTIGTFSNFPPEIDGCSCYYSKDSLDLKNGSYLYANDFEQTSFLNINGILTKFIQSEWKELNKTTRTAKGKSAQYELTIEIHDVRKNGDETWINTGIINVKDKNGNKTTRTFYGECGC
jgi:hypothetical protein